MNDLALSLPEAPWVLGLGAFAVVVLLLCLPRLLGIVYIPHTQVGIIEKIWSGKGSLREGQIIARSGEAGFQARFLRGGIHFGLYPWQYRIHKEPLVVVAEGKMAYVYARDGVPLEPIQTLGRSVDSNHFQDAFAFLEAQGQRGRQRGILREGVYAINLALFVVITEERVFSGPVKESADRYESWKAQLAGLHAFDPIVIGAGQSRFTAHLADTSASEAGSPPSLAAASPDFNPSTDTIGVVSIQDGPTIGSGEIIAPEVKATPGLDHNYFQDPEAFLALGGKRGKQLQVLTDGTFFINRWFGTVEIKAKTLIPIGYVGVVVSYHGAAGSDTTGESFRYGEQVESGQRGVWRSALTPGKYALNPYAVKVELVPTINFVLRWISGQTEAHHYDEDLTSIDLITADGYEPRLPLSLVLHIDYQKAPSVVQRFGDVKRLITQTLDPILTAYFRDVAQTSHMLDLLTEREEIQRHATEELGARFQKYDINVVAVLIGRPESREIAAGQADPIETLFDQLRMRRLADEQRATYAKQQEAAQQQVALNEAKAKAERQTELTQSAIAVEIAANRGQAEFAEAEQLAKKQVTLAEGEARSKELIGKGESSRIAQVGLAEAAVTLQKVGAFRDPRLYALNVFADRFSQSVQPLVPSRLFISNGAGSKPGEPQGNGSVLETLLSLILSEKAGINIQENTTSSKPLEEFIRKFTSSGGSGNGNPVKSGVPEPAEKTVARSS
ncbi:MAG TPA: SPFH domain-containing protein [Chthoniobacterales bacterium]|nr:SPFH domain-containing protein [Chthoniobacterales bacterium]